jgi:hypothetical protein
LARRAAVRGGHFLERNKNMNNRMEMDPRFRQALERLIEYLESSSEAFYYAGEENDIFCDIALLAAFLDEPNPDKALVRQQMILKKIAEENRQIVS